MKSGKVAFLKQINRYLSEVWKSECRKKVQEDVIVIGSLWLKTLTMNAIIDKIPV